MITYGATKINEAYIGETQADVVERSRELINQWPEYADCTDEEMIETLLDDEAEFDMVQIQGDFQGYNLSLKEMISLYESSSFPPHIYASPKI
jgi:hypothetical protein